MRMIAGLLFLCGQLSAVAQTPPNCREDLSPKLASAKEWLVENREIAETIIAVPLQQLTQQLAIDSALINRWPDMSLKQKHRTLIEIFFEPISQHSLVNPEASALEHLSLLERHQIDSHFDVEFQKHWEPLTNEERIDFLQTTLSERLPAILGHPIVFTSGAKTLAIRSHQDSKPLAPRLTPDLVDFQPIRLTVRSFMGIPLLLRTFHVRSALKLILSSKQVRFAGSRELWRDQIFEELKKYPSLTLDEFWAIVHAVNRYSLNTDNNFGGWFHWVRNSKAKTKERFKFLTKKISPAPSYEQIVQITKYASGIFGGSSTIPDSILESWIKAAVLPPSPKQYHVIRKGSPLSRNYFVEKFPGVQFP